jgi:hypothetical protein
MGRNAKASSSKLPTRQVKEGRKVEKNPIPREPESEAESASDDEEVDEDDLLEEVEEEEGIAQYAPDDWDGEDRVDLVAKKRTLQLLKARMRARRIWYVPPAVIFIVDTDK